MKIDCLKKQMLVESEIRTLRQTSALEKIMPVLFQ